jgi:hypothetical protein
LAQVFAGVCPKAVCSPFSHYFWSPKSLRFPSDRSVVWPTVVAGTSLAPISPVGRKNNTHTRNSP